MRYLTKNEVTKMGHTPVLSIFDRVLKLRMANSGQTISRDDDQYGIMVLMADLETLPILAVTDSHTLKFLSLRT